MDVCWRPIEEYVERPDHWRTDLVLLGWFDLGGGGYPPGIIRCGVGWFDFGKKWVDASDKKRWPRQPTHFACVASDIPIAPGLHRDWEFGEVTRIEGPALIPTPGAPDGKLR